MTIFVVSMSGKPLMPTFNIKKVRKLLKNGKAKIINHDPFTIQLLYISEENTQGIEMTVDTGYEHIGLSVKSEKHEYAHEERILLKDEKAKHETCSREHRRPRRIRKRHRKARFDNREKPKKWLAPSLKNKADRHVDLVKRFISVCPIKRVTLEVGEFDTMALQAIEEGKPLPQGEDYQNGPKYSIDTLRKAVFQRDNYTCITCGRSIEDGAILHVHHLGFWKGDRSNRMSNLGTECEICHIPKNHKPGGKLWGLGPRKGFSGAAFMNAVKWYIYEQVKALGVETHFTYGVTTAEKRKALNIEKTHANDAYAMGEYHPKHKAHEAKYQKKRRNNRVLEKFYDAKFVDTRDSKTKKASELGSNRNKRSVPRNNNQNERKYRGEKKSKGRRTIRKTRHEIQPGAVCVVNNRKIKAKGCHCNGTRVLMADGKSYAISKVKVLYQPSGWERTN